MDKNLFNAGLDRLAKPVLPLVRLVQILFLTGPFNSAKEVASQLNEPIETSCLYEDPQTILAPYLDILEEFQRLKHPSPANYTVLNEDNTPADPFDAIELWVGQQVISRELEAINSLLCGPCDCTLCCIGPDKSLTHNFFEIPLSKAETEQFSLDFIDTKESLNSTSNQQPPLVIKDKPFYELESAIYHWQNGWSLILPRNATCPQLQSSRCQIYPTRPDVCRRPQIFPYVLENEASTSQNEDGTTQPTYISRRKILAIWDCPYVKQFKEEIAAYAEMCEFEPIFKENKA